MSDDSPTLRQMLLMLHADITGVDAQYLDLPESLHRIIFRYERALAILDGQPASRQMAALIYTMWSRQEAMRDE